MSLERARAWLATHRNDDGSWGYLPGDAGAPEPTLLAAAAGAGADLAWLQAADLGWARLLLPAALSRVEGAEALRRAAVEKILVTEAAVPETDLDLTFDVGIPAWSWYPETSAWVQPTAYAVLSLRRSGRADHPRTRQGIRMLLDRQCSDGGWNYGNPAILGATLDSDLPPTGWTVLALPSSQATERGLERLRDALDPPSTTRLSLAILAWTAHDRDPAPFVDALRARQGADGGFSGRVDWTALATCALEAATHRTSAFFVTAGAP